VTAVGALGVIPARKARALRVVVVASSKGTAYSSDSAVGSLPSSV
jgi:hypothetical protein